MKATEEILEIKSPKVNFRFYKFHFINSYQSLQIMNQLLFY